MFEIVPRVRKTAAILLPKTHIFLLSHMRAYTSLFGHIMGSNPAICGYYEMHIGYHSWKSPIRQKLLYFRQETAKPGFTCMFDKILHNEHNVALDVLNSRRARNLFCLRRPQDVIPSILKLYRDIDPAHEFNSEAFATRYYVDRLAMLNNMAEHIERGFFYFDAESLKLRSGECLGRCLCLGVRPAGAGMCDRRGAHLAGFGQVDSALGSGPAGDLDRLSPVRVSGLKRHFGSGRSV